ncbi:Ig-like domain-containing protein [Deinococcus ruber]|uniref:SbsA Ig-like domain-containing protein n=1 Tax=Deinococcus ruber TaxID=1848197 RepID=A0A918C469_9DEIO|nr:Ig-like domain-containing protein [Deinococcus ruber]GGR03916.1 hypothetical protein GCM10008957_16090 [Deinococcus ruber]
MIDGIHGSTKKWTAAVLLLPLVLSACGGTPSGQAPAHVAAQSLGTGTPERTLDVTRPTLSTLLTYPNDGGVGILPEQAITLQFSEPMNKAATQAAFSFLNVQTPAPAYLSVTWNAPGTVMTLKRSLPFAYGSTVFWMVGAGATDLSGNSLEPASSVARSFTVSHHTSIKVYSDGSLDGSVNRNNQVETYSDHVNLRATASAATISRGFLTFDLSGLPKLSQITSVQSASLHVYQNGVATTADMYAVPGAVLAYNVSYFLLFPTLYGNQFDIGPVSTGTTKILSTDALPGYKVMDATTQVAYDIVHRSQLLSRSQWLLRHAFDFSSNPAYCCGVIEWASGGAVQARRPYLEISYLYP